MKKILIIEDSISMMENIKEMINNNFDCHILEAFDGLQGIKIARESEPDVILMDIVLPYISGYAATVRLRKIEGMKQTIIIGMTADVDENTRDKVLTWCDNFIPKPIDEKSFIELLKKYLSKNNVIKENKISIGKSELLKEQVTSEIVEQLEMRVVELEEAKNRIEYLNQLKTRLMSLFSHEIKTPLTTITGYSECIKLMSANSLSEEENNMLDRMSAAAKRINSLLEEVNFFNRVQFNEARKKSGNPFHAIKRIVEKRSKYIKEKKITILLDCDRNKVINIDEMYFGDIFDQILKNAIVYNVFEGEIFVELKFKNAECILKVIDSGCGVQDSMLNSIFDPLTQAVDIEHYQTHQLRGLGMGLAICKQMVENVGGRVALNARTDKTGTVVTVILPENK